VNPDSNQPLQKIQVLKSMITNRYIKLEELTKSQSQKKGQEDWPAVRKDKCLLLSTLITDQDQALIVQIKVSAHRPHNLHSS